MEELQQSVEKENRPLTISQKIASGLQKKSVLNETPERITSTFAYIFTLIGLRKENIPDAYDVKVLVKYLQENLGRFSLEDMINAFTFGVQGRLDMKIECYEKFSPFYLEQVMQSYARFRMTHQERNQITEQCTLTDQEKEKIILDGLVKSFNDYKTSKKLFDFGGIYYTTLERIGAINLSIERKKEIYRQAERMHVMEQEKKITSPTEHRAAIREGLLNFQAETTVERIKMIAREIALREYFDNLIEMDIDITEII